MLMFKLNLHSEPAWASGAKADDSKTPINTTIFQVLGMSWTAFSRKIATNGNVKSMRRKMFTHVPRM